MEKGMKRFSIPFKDKLFAQLQSLGLLLSVAILIPCVATASPVRIMPLGNSITKGTAGSDLDIGYRRALYIALEDSGFDVDFVGTQVHGLVTDFDRDHEGHGGWEADEIRDNIYNWLCINPADYVLLHIGTNDVSHNHIDVSEVEVLLDEIDRFENDYSNPIKVLVSRIILRADSYNPQTITFNDSVETLVMNRIAGGDDLRLVRMDSALVYPDDLADNVHPNQGGYDKMAEVWYNHLIEFLPYTRCPDDMSHYWKLDGSGFTEYEDSWASSDATCSICPDSVDGIVNGAQQFGGGAELSVPGDASFDWSFVSSFSIELWMKMGNCFAIDEGRRQVFIGRNGSGFELERWLIGANCLKAVGEARIEFYLEDSSEQVSLLSPPGIDDDQWHHVVAVRDASLDSNILYVDGELVSSMYCDYTGGFESDSNISFANLADSVEDFSFDGELDEVAVYDRALLQSEVEIHYNLGLNGYPYCEGSIEPEILTSPLTEAYTNQNYGYNIVAEGDPIPVYRLVQGPGGMVIDSVTGMLEWVPQWAGTVEVVVSAANVAGSDDQPFQIDVHEPPPCPENLKHYWGFDEVAGPVYYDFVGDADAEGGVLDTVDGICGFAQQFNRLEGDFLNIPDHQDFDMPPDASFTIEFWLKKSSLCDGNTNSSNNVIIGRYDGSPGTGNLNIWWIGINCYTTEGTQGGVRFVLRDDLDVGYCLVGSTNVIDGMWHHVVATRNGSSGVSRIFVDGDLDGETTYSFTGGFDDDSPVNVGYIGFGSNFYFDGIIDELAFYGREIGEEEISDHYLCGLQGMGYCPEYVCGDANTSGESDIDDVVYIVAYIFSGMQAPVPLTSGDVDCSGECDIDDVVYLIGYIFLGGPAPCADCP